MKKAFYKNNAPVVYFFVLHMLAGKCTNIYNACKTIAQLIINPFFCDVFAAVVVCARSLLLWSIKSHDFDLSYSVCFYICDLNLEVIEKLQTNNYRLPHWKKTVPFGHGNFWEIRPGSFGRMVSAHGLRRAYRKAVFLASSSDNKSAR